MQATWIALASVLAGTLSLATGRAQEGGKYKSHPPARPLPTASNRPLDAGPHYYVHPVEGNDASEGSKERPWRTIAHGVKQLKAGDTLVLRGGTYYEHVTARLAGTLEKPITIRSFPGEMATLDGGIGEFFASPAESWEPCPDGAAGEFRSVKTYAGLAEEAGDGPAVFGNFGDSLVPLEAYRFHGDLRSDNPFWNVQNKVGDESFVYCGPGIFYDRETSRIHCRLAHTKLSGLSEDNYRGETDPRKLPLVIAGSNRPPLELRDSQNVRLYDLVLRGSRKATLQIRDCRNIELDGVTAYGGWAAMQVADTHGFRMQHSACRGIGAPWTFRGMLKYRSVEGRLFSASHWDPTGNDNRDFEIRFCEFTDCVDGVFLGNVRRVHFSHNLVENVTDDGVFLTSGTGYDGHTHGGDIHIYQNRFARILTTFAFGVGHGRQKMTEKGRQTGSGVWIYRNVFDLRRPVWYTWPSGPDAPQEITSRGRFASDHGGPTWEPMWIYHNTILAGGTPRYDYGCDGLIHGVVRGTSRRVYNNIICLTEGTPVITLPKSDLDFDGDGNLFWSLKSDKPLTSDLFAKFRASPAYEESKKQHPAGWTTHDKVAEPKFVRLSANWREEAELSLQEDSPAKAAGIGLPPDWPDAFRSDRVGVDIGALSSGTNAVVGVNGRLLISGVKFPNARRRQGEPWKFEPAGNEPPPVVRALIVAGYPAFDAPIAAYLLRKAGWQVEETEKVWFDAAKLGDYKLIIYDGSLARAKAPRTAFDAADLAHVRKFLESGGTLVLTRERYDLFASAEGRKFLEELVGTGKREKDAVLRLRQPDHPWLKHLPADKPLPWLAKGSPLPTTKGESLIGSDSGLSLLHVAPLGKGRLIYLGWSPAVSLPNGRQPATVEQEADFEAQVAILGKLLTSATKANAP